MENNSNNRNILIGILAGATAGAAIGFYLAHKREHETGRQIRDNMWSGVKEVAMAKGIEIIDELMKKYSDSHSHVSQPAEKTAA